MSNLKKNMCNWKKPSDELPEDESDVMIAIKEEDEVTITNATYYKHGSFEKEGNIAYKYSADEVVVWCYEVDYWRAIKDVLKLCVRI